MEEFNTALGAAILFGSTTAYLIINSILNKKKYQEKMEDYRNKGFKEGANYIITTLDFNMDGITDSDDVKKMFGIFNKLKREVDRAGGAIKNVL